MEINKMRDKRHCCCCIKLSDGVLLVGIYGFSFHTSLLIIQLTRGHTLTPSPPTDPYGDSIIHPILVAVHTVGLVVNSLLVLGSVLSKRPLMIPWLLGQGLISVSLACFALHYLVLFPEQECYNPSDPTNILNTECHILLWHSVIMIFSLLTLFYYFYIVYEFVEQMKHEEKCILIDPESTASTVVIADSSTATENSLISVRDLSPEKNPGQEVDLKQLHEQHMSHFQQLSVKLLPHEQQLNGSLTATAVGKDQQLNKATPVKPKVEKRVRIQEPVPSEDGFSTGRSNPSLSDNGRA